MNKKHSRYPLIAKIGTALQVTEKCYTPHVLHPHLSCIGQTAFKHFDLMEGTVGNGYVGERYSK